MRIQFSKDKILERIRFENPWWEASKIETYYSSMKKREYYKLFFPLVTETEIKRAVILMGPRRVGKTVLIFHTIQGLIDKGIPPKNICYLSVETPIYNGIGLEELLHYLFEITGNKPNTELYIFFDEIQYLKAWEVHLKSLVDSYHHLKFIVSGSAAAALKIKSNESGAGRFTDFILPPLTFDEYLSLKGITGLVKETISRRGQDIEEQENYEYSTDHVKDLNMHFVDYINFGGYPEVSLSKTIKEDPGRYIRNDIIDKVLLRDLPLLYGIEDIQELNSLFTYIAYNTGYEMSLDSIAQSSGVSKNTIKKYITYLEAAFLIKVVNRVNESGKKFKRANFFKIYLTNPSLRCALFTPISIKDPFFGNLVETAIFSQWQHSQTSQKHLFYARWNNGEVDMVHLSNSLKPDWAVEIKWSNKPYKDYSELKNIIAFCKTHKLDHTLVTSVDIYEDREIQGLGFKFIPASLYCFEVGKNMIKNKIKFRDYQM